MLALAISCWLLGMVVAQYFRIFVIAPLALASCATVAMIGAAQEHSTQSIILACMVIVVCLQLGFLFGAFIAAPTDDRRSSPIRKEEPRYAAFKPRRGHAEAPSANAGEERPLKAP